MARLIIHAGTSKTGTSSIQTSLLVNQRQLAAAGVYALKSNRSRPRRSAKHRLAWRDPTDSSWAQLRDELDQVRDTDDTFVISNETLFSLRDQQLKLLAGHLEGFEVAVLVYVRNQADYLQTLCLQHQKPRERQIDLEDEVAVGEFIERRIRGLDYYAMGERFESAFGVGTVHARVFDRRFMVDKDLLVDFFHFLGIEDPSALDLSTSANPSLNRKYATTLNREYDRLVENTRYADVLDMALRLSSLDQGTKWFLTEGQVAEIQEEFRDSNQQFFSKFVDNADAFPEAENFADPTESGVDTTATADEMLDLLAEWPRLTQKGWSRKAGAARRIFRTGWVIARTPHGVVVEKEPGVSSLRFRLPARRVGQWATDDLHLVFGLVDASVNCDVGVNGGPAATIRLGEEPVKINLEALGELDQVEITISTSSDSDELRICSMDVELPGNRMGSEG
ncbi:MAG: hypothetical protein GY701_08820 [Sulfitobacter sp.]|nr:hypothetical protein [Sulfitobacter sp.]